MNRFDNCTVNSGSDFSTVKVGDRLWLRDNLYEGWVTVKAVYPTNFRVFVNSYEAWVSKDGKWADDGPQIIFYSKVEIIPPPRPRRLVKKTVEIIPCIFSGDNLQYIKRADSCGGYKPNGPIQTIEIEVEE